MIKDKTIRSQKPGGKLRWAVCTDGSEKSLKAFHVLARLLDKSRDEVLAITVVNNKMDVSQIQELITEHFRSEGVSIDIKSFSFLFSTIIRLTFRN